jgi:creatinine amidohydrolase
MNVPIDDQISQFPNLHRLLELSWVELNDLDKEQTVVLIPVSPIEEHGPHLPIGTDILGAHDIAEAAAQNLCRAHNELHVVLAPALPLGCAPITADFPGTISISGTTFSKLLVEVFENLVKNGFRYIIVTNHHLDSMHLKAIIDAIETVEQQYDVRIIETAGRLLYSGIPLGEIEAGKKLGLQMKTEVHGDVRETSYILHKHPNLLKKNLKVMSPVLIDVGRELKSGKKTFKEMGATDGYIGSPASATEEIGRLHLQEQAALIAQMAVNLMNGQELPEMKPNIAAYFKNRISLE